MTRPNLFTFATKELSQDAFICWLLSWAHDEFKNSDTELHDCAVAMIHAMFVKHDKKPPTQIGKVEVRKQDKQIDVLCIINEEYVILIEDKTYTSNHSNQLEKYYKDVKSRKFETKNIIPIYYKTGDQSDYCAVKKAGYKPFLRPDILSVLRLYKGTNPILLDYREYIESIESRVNEYEFLTEKKWKTGSLEWVGFFKQLQTKLEKGRWKYVPNPRGGFMSFMWGAEIEGRPYLLLEEGKLCFKICVTDKSDRNASYSKSWCKALIAARDKSKHELNLIKPERFGAGKNMTVCIAKEYRVWGSDNRINVEETVRKLLQAEAILKAAKPPVA
jgi:hypothetical protein